MSRSPVSPLAVVAITLTGVFAAVGLLVAALGWLVVAFLDRPADPNRETRVVEVKKVEYDDCRQVVTGVLERHYDWYDGQEMIVTVTARTPDGPADGVSASVRCQAKATGFEIELTDEQAAVFGHPDAKRTVNMRRADGQLMWADAGW